MPKARRSNPDPGTGSSTGPAGPSNGPEAKQEPPKERVKTPEERDEERPDVAFIRDFDEDLLFAFRWESTLEMESDLEAEMAQALIDEGEAEPWAAQIMRHSWSADPKPRDIEDFSRFRMTPDAFKAMQITDPMEAMLVAQARAMYTNALYMLREGTRLGSLNTKPEVVMRAYTIAAKLAATYAKLMESLKKYRAQGEQKVRVEYERVDRGTQSPAKVSRSKRERLTVSGNGVDVADFAKRPDKEPVPVAAVEDEAGND
jgi:hypothetical protein